MFQEEYKAVFSQITASERTYQEVMNMANNRKERKTTNFIPKLLYVAAIISMLTVSVSAAENVRNWFADYISQFESESLTEQQMELVENSQQNFAQSVTQDGYTMELKSAITDGEKAYICIGILAPEDVVLNTTNIDGYLPEAPDLITMYTLKDQNDRVLSCYSSIVSVEDNDGKANTQNLILEFTADEGQPYEKTFGPETVWNLRMENLTAKYFNAAYDRELTNGKYKDQENFFYTDEEGKLLWPEVLLAEGTWDFTIQFTDQNCAELELVQEPFTCNSILGWNDAGEKIYQEVTISSFVLRTFSASIQTEDNTFAPDFWDVHVVMADGSKIALDAESGGPGECHLYAVSPILLDQVSHVLLGDGTEIPVSQLSEE